MRIAKVSRDDLTSRQRKAFDRITRDAEINTSTGPGLIELNSPEAYLRVIGLSRYLRKRSVVRPKLRELAILVTARELDCDYVWRAHSSSANKAGIGRGLVEAIRAGHAIAGLKADEESTVMFAQELLRAHNVTDDTFQAALKALGSQGLTELTMLIGYYTMIAFLCNAFEA